MPFPSCQTETAFSRHDGKWKSECIIVGQLDRCELPLGLAIGLAADSGQEVIAEANGTLGYGVDEIGALEPFFLIRRIALSQAQPPPDHCH